MSSQGSGPRIGIMVEYDALPGIGHACGHNLIAEAGIAASLGLKHALQQVSLYFLCTSQNDSKWEGQFLSSMRGILGI